MQMIKGNWVLSRSHTIEESIGLLYTNNSDIYLFAFISVTNNL
jgi:hypothetical protein